MSASRKKGELQRRHIATEGTEHPESVCAFADAGVFWTFSVHATVKGTQQELTYRALAGVPVELISTPIAAGVLGVRRTRIYAASKFLILPVRLAPEDAHATSATEPTYPGIITQPLRK